MLACLALAGPGLVQILEMDMPMVRSWQMYGTVGQGAPYGVFEVIQGDGVVETVDIRAVLGVERVVELQPYPGSGGITRDFLGETEFAAAAGPLCDGLAEDQKLNFSGRVAARWRWKPVELGHDRLCSTL